METPGNNQVPILCRSGCGFYGTSGTEGMCSKCYKDYLKKQQVPPTGSSFRGDVPVSAPSCIDTASTTVPVILPSSSIKIKESGGADDDVKPDGATGLAAAAAAAADEVAGKDAEALATQSAAAADADGQQPATEQTPEKKKKNRCAVCKKKLGLTGFGCRCGGLFCAVHRYSDKHDCSFDYRTHGAEEIRKNNPVIKGEKVKQI